MRDVYLVVGKVVFLLMAAFIAMLILNRIVAFIMYLHNKNHKSRMHKHRVRISAYCGECIHKNQISCPMNSQIYNDDEGYCSKGTRS